MSYFFTYQPEFLYSINLFLSPTIFGMPVVTFIGILLVCIFLFFLINNKKYSNNIIIGLILILWLPLFARFFYNSFSEVRRTLFLVKEPYTEQTRWRYCSIDLYQNLGGSLCQVSKFTDFIHQNIPEGSQIAFAQSPVTLYLEYQLVDRYKVSKNFATADYILLYHPQENFNLSSDGRLSRFQTSLDNKDIIKEDFFGYFKIEGQVNQQMVIFKRI